MAYLRISNIADTVTYEDTFTHTIDVSFSDLTPPLDPAYIEFFMPSTINYTLPNIQGAIRTINEIPATNGTIIQVEYGPVNQTGLSTSFDIVSGFSLDAKEESTFALEASLYINNTEEPLLTEVASPVTLQINENYTLTTNTIIPNSTDSAPGGSVIYEVILTNIGEQWPTAAQFTITYDFSSIPNLILDTTTPIIGEDISTSPFKDTSADGIVAEFNASSDGFTFTLPSYRGESYRFYFKAFVAESAEIGSTITVLGRRFINKEQMEDSVDILRISEPNYSATSQTYGPLQVQPGNYMNYTNYLENDGNQDLSGVLLEYEVPFDKIQSFQLETGSFMIRALETPLTDTYRITYETDTNPPVEYPLESPGHTDGIYRMDQSETLYLQDLIPEDRTVRYVRWKLGDLPVGAIVKQRPRLQAYGLDSLQYGTNITFHTNLYWQLPNGTTQEVSNNFSTPVSLLSELVATNHTVRPRNNVIPGTILTITSTFDCSYSQLNNPIICCLLSDKLELVLEEDDPIDSFYIQYTDGLTGITLNSIDNKEEISLPDLTFVPNYNNTPYTLIRLSYTNDAAKSFLQNSTILIQYKAKVKIGSVGTFTSYAVLGNEGDFGAISRAANTYTELAEEDIDGDFVLREQLARTPKVTTTILDYASIVAVKESRGSLDNSYVNFPELATTYPGGTIDFLISVQNNGNQNIDTIEIVDIIPHVGDTGVILVNTKRGSEFPVYQVTRVDTNLYESDGTLVAIPPTISVLYSQSYDPVRFGNDGKPIGTVNDWSQKEPDPITSLGAYKVLTSDVSIQPGQILTLHIVAIAPIDSQVKQISWNSFALQATYTNVFGEVKTLLPAEPAKAGVQILDNSTLGVISGFVWLDSNQDGIYQEDEIGVNDIGVILYKVDGNRAYAVDSTITINNSVGDAGRYSFTVEEEGEYLVRFVPNEYEYTLTKQVLTEPMGSLANPYTKHTNPFLVRIPSITTNIITGLIPFSQADFILSTNKAVTKTVRSTIYSQLLLEMKLTDTMKL